MCVYIFYILLAAWDVNLVDSKQFFDPINFTIVDNTIKQKKRIFAVEKSTFIEEH